MFRNKLSISIIAIIMIIVAIINFKTILNFPEIYHSSQSYGRVFLFIACCGILFISILCIINGLSKSKTTKNILLAFLYIILELTFVAEIIGLILINS